MRITNTWFPKPPWLQLVEEAGATRALAREMIVSTSWRFLVLQNKQAMNLKLFQADHRNMGCSAGYIGFSVDARVASDHAGVN